MFDHIMFENIFIKTLKLKSNKTDITIENLKF